MPPTRPLIGWREWVTLPTVDPSLTPTKAKVDTGARTSSIHAFDLRVTERDGVAWAEFVLHPLQRTDEPSHEVASPVAEFRDVRSSTGQIETRPVIRTSAAVGCHTLDIELTLASRDEMGFRMLLGRSALRGRFWVEPARSFILSKNIDLEPEDADEDPAGGNGHPSGSSGGGSLISHRGRRRPK